MLLSFFFYFCMYIYYKLYIFFLFVGLLDFDYYILHNDARVELLAPIGVFELDMYGIVPI